MKRVLLLLGLVSVLVAACGRETGDVGAPKPSHTAGTDDEIVVLAGSPADVVATHASFIVADSAATPRAVFEQEAPSRIAQADCDELAETVPDTPPCTPTREVDRATASGADLVVWNTGTNEPTVTVAFGNWTLVLRGPDTALALQIADALEWEERPTGDVAVWSSDDSVQVQTGAITEDETN